MKKAQVALEFVLLCSAVIVLVTVLISSASFNTSLARQKNEQEALGDLANYIQQEIMLASKTYPNYTRIFQLPERIVGKEYFAELTDYHLTINTDKFTVNRGIPLIDQECIGQFNLGGSNTISKIQTGEEVKLKLNCLD